jgi:hypothetical protein
MLNKTITCVAVLGLVFAIAPAASAEVVHNWFWADMDASTNTIIGSGYIDGEPMYQDTTFFEYPQDQEPTWSNAWSFNGGPIEGSKWIEYSIQLSPNEPDMNGPTMIEPGMIVVEVAINWSGPNWLDTTRPPTDPAEDPFIVREIVYEGPVDFGFEINNRGNPILIPDYNPIWVSYDVRVLDYAAGTDPFLGGDIQLWHEHVPEPATMSLPCIGGLAMLRRKRQK